jgi:hypothetical protein
MEIFRWTTFDVRTLMSKNWEKSIIDAATKLNKQKQISPPHVTSREAPAVKELTIRGVGADALRSELSWLDELYRTTFRNLAQLLTTEPVSVAAGKRHTVVLNVQCYGDMRYECHVDTNPIQGMLYVTTHPPGDGGELVVCNNTRATCLSDIDSDCTVIYPVSGHLLFFDGRHNAHYIRPMTKPGSLRVAVAMNFYIPSVPETLRPPDLDDYLYGTPLKI